MDSVKCGGVSNKLKYSPIAHTKLMSVQGIAQICMYNRIIHTFSVRCKDKFAKLPEHFV